MQPRSAIAVTVLCTVAGLSFCAAKRFEVQDTFRKDGQQLQIISGSLHYQRVHPAYWKDRLMRLQALGCNTVSFYVPWNVHEPRPGVYSWKGFADVEGYLRLVQELGMNVLLRLGPYICAEWDFGGMPWWLAADQLTDGGGNFTLRDNDPKFLKLVDRWFAVMLPRMRPFLIENGGPVLMVQVENELGFLSGDNQGYLRHLVATTRQHLGSQVVIYTTDPPPNVQKGSLPGREVFTAVDFGAGWFDLDYAYGQQRSMNPPGQSPPLCAEFYTGWLTFWGDKMANTSLLDFVGALESVLDYANGTGSVNFYMGFGGTNFGWTAGGTGGDHDYKGIITSYDYDTAISEAGDYGQPGIGGPNKFEAIRQVIQQRGYKLPDPPPRPAIAAYGPVKMQRVGSLLAHLPLLSKPVPSQYPQIMENYGQMSGLIVYQTRLEADQVQGLRKSEHALLELGLPVRDYATVLLDGLVMGRMDRNGPANLSLSLSSLSRGRSPAVLSIVVEAVGRANEGWRYDAKGLKSPAVTLHGQRLGDWTAWPLPLDNVDLLTSQQLQPAMQRAASQHGPALYRGLLNVSEPADPETGLLPATYLDITCWHKGVMFVNGFNLGWFWPDAGPATTMYVPGAILHSGANELVLLAVMSAPKDVLVEFSDLPSFYGPASVAEKCQGRTETAKLSIS